MLFADHQLAGRLEVAEADALREYAAALGRLRPDRGAAALSVAGGCAAFAGADSPLTQATGLGMAGPVTAADLDALEAFFRGRGAPIRIQWCPLADPSALLLLAERGYCATAFLNVLVRSLRPAGEAEDATAATLPGGARDHTPEPAGGACVGISAAPGGGAQGVTPDAPDGAAASIRVTQVAPGTADIWARTVTQGFYGRDDVPDEALEIATVNTHTADTACFLAWAGEEPAGGGAVSLRRGVATFFSTSTRPAFRGQGVQTALIRARLAHAAAAGCDLAMVRTTPGSGSQRNVERAGFGVVYTKGVLARG